MYTRKIRHKPIKQPATWLILGILMQCCLVGCSSTPTVSSHTQPTIQNAPGVRLTSPSQAGRPAVELALGQLDKPYRYGGYTPKGFDCSGLVYFAFSSNGISIPRTSHEQCRHSRPIDTDQIQPGDLLFFRIERKQPSHVGLYIGSGQFIHASTSEKAVALSQLENPYWKKRLISAGRY